MKIVYFVHAIASCWNNGNAHFLRGVGRELQAAGHDVLFCEPANEWSETNLLRDHGGTALEGFARAYPDLKRIKYDPDELELDALTADADLVIVHEWNRPELVNALVALRRRGAGFVLLFHDTHHRALTQPEEMQRFDLNGFDGVLAFGGVLTELYKKRGWGNRVWTWHEAADTSVFYPRPAQPEADLVWIGNWGDEERGTEIEEYLLNPAQQLRLSVNVFGVRYPENAIHSLTRRGFHYWGWLANYAAPEVFARHRFTIHVPRRPYAEALPGIPTIRVFEALACGIPLVSAPWSDTENLFPQGCFLMARNSAEMRNHMRAVLADSALAEFMRSSGLKVIQEKHSCRHRVGELLSIYEEIKGAPAMILRESEAA